MISCIPIFLKRSCVLLLLLVLASGCARTGTRSVTELVKTATQPGATDTPSSIEWVKYYEALGTASRAPSPTYMLYFMKSSCEPCEMMEKWTFTDDRVLRAMKDFVPVKIKGDVELQIVRRFNVNTYPMIIFVKMKGGEIDRKVGYRDADFLVEWMERVQANRATVSALQEELKRKPADLELLLKQAHNYLDADEIDRALETAETAADVAPGDASVLAFFGLCQLRQNNLEEAEAAIGAALEVDAENEEARRLKIALSLKRADDAAAKGDVAGAIELFLFVLELDRDSFDAHMGMGRAHTRLDEKARAIAEFQRAALLRPKSPVPHAALGHLYQQLDDDVMAEKEFLKAIEIEPRYEPPYFRLMESYEKRGMRTEMMAMYEGVLPLEPAGAHNEIAWLMATSKHAEILDPEEAIKHASVAVELEAHPWYMDTLAEAYYANGQYDLAIAIIREAMAKEPDDMPYYQGQLEKFQKAKEWAPGGINQEEE